MTLIVRAFITVHWFPYPRIPKLLASLCSFLGELILAHKQVKRPFMLNSQIVQNRSQPSCDLVSVVNICYVLIQLAFRSLGDHLWENLQSISAFINEKEETTLMISRVNLVFRAIFFLPPSLSPYNHCCFLTRATVNLNTYNRWALGLWCGL